MENKMNYLNTVVLISLAVTHISWAEIYKYSEPNGVVLFSDRPSQNAEIIQLRSINSYAKTTQSVEPNRQTPTMGGYAQLSIVSPINQQNFHNQPDIPVIITLQPALKSSDNLELWLDGSFYQRNNNLKFNLHQIDRGEHQVEMKITSSLGKTLITSEPITLFVHYGSSLKMRPA